MEGSGYDKFRRTIQILAIFLLLHQLVQAIPGTVLPNCNNQSVCNQTLNNVTLNSLTVYLQTISPLINVAYNSTQPVNSSSLANTKESVGIILKLWEYAAQQSQIFMQYTFSQNYSSDDGENGLLLADIVLLHVESIDYDNGDTQVTAWTYNTNFYQVSTVAITTENYYLMFPSILYALINEIVWQFFFIFMLTYVPWLLFNTQLKYFFMEKEVKKLNYFKGFMVTMKSLFLSQHSSIGGVIYSVFFIAGSVFIMTIILSDYIYIIAMVLKNQSIQDFSEVIATNSTLCIVKSDTLSVELVKKYTQIYYVIEPEIKDCISYVNSNNQNSALLISEFLIRDYYTINTGIGFQLKYVIKQKSMKRYFFLAHQRIVNSTEYQVIQQALLDMTEQKKDQQIINEYFYQMQSVYGNTQSVWTRETALYFGSLSLIALIVCVFLVMLIRNEKQQINYNRLRLQDLFVESLQKNQKDQNYLEEVNSEKESPHINGRLRQNIYKVEQDNNNIALIAPFPIKNRPNRELQGDVPQRIENISSICSVPRSLKKLQKRRCSLPDISQVQERQAVNQFEEREQSLSRYEQKSFVEEIQVIHRNIAAFHVASPVQQNVAQAQPAQAQINQNIV